MSNHSQNNTLLGVASFRFLLVISPSLNNTKIVNMNGIQMQFKYIARQSVVSVVSKWCEKLDIIKKACVGFANVTLKNTLTTTFL